MLVVLCGTFQTRLANRVRRFYAAGKITDPPIRSSACPSTVSFIRRKHNQTLFPVCRFERLHTMHNLRFQSLTAISTELPVTGMRGAEDKLRVYPPSPRVWLGLQYDASCSCPLSNTARREKRHLQQDRPRAGPVSAGKKPETGV